MKALECTKTLAEGCYDVFFTETKDAGKTWTEPIPVPRPQKNDAIHRTCPKILHLLELDRLIIAYSLHAQNTIRYELATVARPSGSSILTSEVKIEYWTYPIYDMTFAYAKFGTEIQIYLFVNTYKKIERFTSTNSGVFWVYNFIRGDSTNYTYAVANSWEKDQIYIASLGANGIFIIHWRESDLTWHQRQIKLTKNMTNYRPLAVNMLNMTHTLLITAPIGNEGVATKLYDTEYEYITDLRSPAPESPYMDANALIFKNTTKVRVFHKIDGDLYASSFSYTEKS